MDDCTRLIAYVILIINKSCFHSNQTEGERGRNKGGEASREPVKKSTPQQRTDMQSHRNRTEEMLTGYRREKWQHCMKPSIFVLIIKHCGQSELSQSPLNEQPTVLLTHSRDMNAATQSSQPAHIYFSVWCCMCVHTNALRYRIRRHAHIMCTHAKGSPAVIRGELYLLTTFSSQTHGRLTNQGSLSQPRRGSLRLMGIRGLSVCA